MFVKVSVDSQLEHMKAYCESILAARDGFIGQLEEVDKMWNKKKKSWIYEHLFFDDYIVDKERIEKAIQKTEQDYEESLAKVKALKESLEPYVWIEI